MWLWLVIFLILLSVCFIFMVLSLAFFTLFERKVLGDYQIRLGPNSVGIIGVMQPFSDVISLFCKGIFIPSNVFVSMWIFSPLFSIFVLFLNIFLLPISENFSDNMFSGLAIMVSLTISMYFVLGSYYSGSKFSLLGMSRSLVQMMSYEILIMFFFIFAFFMCKSFNLHYLVDKLNFFSYFSLLLFWVFILLMESGRMPFDLIEGESELVSGFNTEYWGGSFSFFFVYEYGMLVIVSMLTGLFFGNGATCFFLFFIMCFYFIFMRALMPRMRYDLMLIFSWKVFFPYMVFFCLIYFV